MGLNIDSIKNMDARKKKGPNTEPIWGNIARIASYDIQLYKKFSEKDKERFFSEIALLLDAGVDLQTVLKLSLDVSGGKNKIGSVYKQIYDRIGLGSNLSQAMESTNQFSDFDCYSVLIGENTGELSVVFKKLTNYYNRRIVQKRKILSALSYPIVVLVTSVGAIYFMLKFVVPMFSETLTRFGGELPGLTKFVITLSHHITGYVLCTVVLLGLIYFYHSQNKHKDRYQNVMSSIQMMIPFWGKLIYKSHLAQFTQSMELLLNAKVNVLESIELTSKMVKFYPLKIVLAKVAEAILAGSFFYKSMEEQGFFDSSMITLIKIGEEVNQLDRIFLKLSMQYESELEYQSSALVSIIEPLMILLLAILVAIILIAMYLPMFKIGTVIR